MFRAFGCFVIVVLCARGNSGCTLRFVGMLGFGFVVLIS